MEEGVTERGRSSEALVKKTTFFFFKTILYLRRTKGGTQKCVGRKTRSNTFSSLNWHKRHSTVSKKRKKKKRNPHFSCNHKDTRYQKLPPFQLKTLE